ncbi:MAG TPA: TCR/Tet family MFS transporter [Bacteroidia bacterium]|nr:TCR/Tet family MFS transporter [Bacteroidia bacterium]
MHKKHNAALGFIFVTLLVDVTGLGVIIPVTPKLIMSLIHSNSVSDAISYGLWINVIYAVMQFIFSPVLGGLSDQYGRRPILLISLLGFGLDYLVMANAPTIVWLFIVRIFSGIAGASFTTATAYIADISTPEKRAQNFGIVGAAFGMGFIIGPAIGGMLGHYGTRVPFYFSAGLSLLNFVYGYFVVPESLSPDHRRKFDWKRANPVGTLTQLGKYPVVLGMIGSIICIYLAAHATQSTWTYYTMEKFKWDEKMVGWSLAFVGLMIGIVQGGLIRIINPKLGNKKSIYLGFGLYVIGFTLFAFASQSWMMFAFTILYCLGGITGPALQGIMSGEVPANAQGELQGGLTSLISVTSIIGPLMMGYLFRYYTKPGHPYFPGAPFLMGGFLTLIGTVLAVRSLSQTMKNVN